MICSGISTANWFVTLPIHFQVLLIIGVFAALVLIFTIVYYILKGTAYLVYYVLKGVYSLLKEIYYLIFGKEEQKEQSQERVAPQVVIHDTNRLIAVQNTITHVPAGVSFCSECGTKYTDKMAQQLRSQGTAYCVYCGKGFKSERIES